MIDNFDVIKPLFYFNEANNMFFHLQILRRGKDHPDLPAANKLIQSWLVKSREQFDNLKDEVVFSLIWNFKVPTALWSQFHSAEYA